MAETLIVSWATYRTSFLLPSARWIVSQYTKDYTLQSATRLQDLDALFNSIFHGPATTAPKVSHGSFPYLPQSTSDDNTTCAFDNGTSISLDHASFPPLTLSGLRWGYYSETVLNSSSIKLSLLSSPGNETNQLSATNWIFYHTSYKRRRERLLFR